MGYLCTFKCCDLEFDCYDTERILIEQKKSDYFITPSKLQAIEKWKIQNRIKDQIKTKEHLNFFIQQNWISKYQKTT